MNYACYPLFLRRNDKTNERTHVGMKRYDRMCVCASEHLCCVCLYVVVVKAY